MIKKLVYKCIYECDENDMRKFFKKVNILYTDGTNRYDVKHIIEIAQSISKDYPSMKYSDMHLYQISSNECYRHANQIAIEVFIPVEDFLRLKKSHEIEIM